jgi:hypothetical protein
MPTGLALYAFLVGSWGDDAAGTRETWVLAGDRLLGVGFSPGTDGTFFEILEVTPAAYLARPKGADPATSFAVARSTERGARWENPAHDFPQEITYRRAGDRLRAKIGGPGQEAAWSWDLRTVTWDESLLAADRERGREPVAADVSADGTLGFTIAATGVTIWTRTADGGWTLAP